MFEVNLPTKDFADLVLKSDSVLYSMIGVGAFVLTTLGSALLPCAIQCGRQRSKAKQFQKEVQAIAKATAQDLITKSNHFKVLKILIQLKLQHHLPMSCDIVKVNLSRYPLLFNRTLMFKFGCSIRVPFKLPKVVTRSAIKCWLGVPFCGKQPLEKLFQDFKSIILVR